MQKIGDSCFRLNFDILQQYRISWSSDGFEIVDPVGRYICSSQILHVYWRKPFNSEFHEPSDLQRFALSENRYLTREIYNYLLSRGAFALVEEGAERRIGKINQLVIAQSLFATPDWCVGLGKGTVPKGSRVVKSLSGQRLSSSKVLYTTRVEADCLDPGHLWFTQDEVTKDTEVTICFVDGIVAAFFLPSLPHSLDWRKDIGAPETQAWKQLPLTSGFKDRVRQFMSRCDLRFGRLDFVANQNGLFFLEVNPNGQWAWLDVSDKLGLITTVAYAIRGRVHEAPAMEGF